MAKKNYITTDKTLYVEGFLWSGPKGKYHYDLAEKLIPQNLASAERIAGDFARLTSAKVVTVTKVVEQTTITKKLK